MKKSLIVLVCISLCGCDQFIDTESCQSQINEIYGRWKQVAQTATYWEAHWKEKYCKIQPKDKECHN